VLNSATIVPSVVFTLGELGFAAEAFLQNWAVVACSAGVVDSGVWLRISRQHWS
jgi:hypothetical protein